MHCGLDKDTRADTQTKHNRILKTESIDLNGNILQRRVTPLQCPQGPKNSNHLLTPPTLTESPRPFNRSLDTPHVLHDLVRNLRVLRLEIVPLRSPVPVYDEFES